MRKLLIDNRLYLLTASAVGLAASVPVALGQPRNARDARAARRTPVVNVFEANRDAVVNISSTSLVTVRPRLGFDRLFDEIFQLPLMRPQTYRSSTVGSGFVVHPSGYIVTNAHVVSRTTERKVVFADGRQFDADIVVVDTDHDLAVLKIDATDPLPTVRLGRSDDLMVGETVIAIGNPLGYQHTVTAGVVSAVDRTLEFGPGHEYRGLIQTDASINPGNSGGPLLNGLGELIGINTAIRGDAQNIGFAIPVDRLRDLLPQMLDLERLARVEVGMHVGGREPAVVTEVVKGSPADQAGLRTGDVITGLDEARVRRDIDYYFALLDSSPGRPIRVAYERDGRRNETTLTIRVVPKPDGQQLALALFGVELTPPTRAQARRLGMREGRGLLVVGVEAGSPADQLMEPGDLLIQIGRHYLTDAEHLGRLLEAVNKGDEVDVTFLRVVGTRLYQISATLAARG